uniref:Glucosylceramidase n=1 Tax=Zygaena filipendulae TaxID=287375 RepID=A0A1W1EGM7_9NEOP|nr:glucocerebrosidase [Zygaena filipendulae]
MAHLGRSLCLIFVCLAATCCATGIKTVDEDKPCLAQFMPQQSSICICNETYCDEITRQIPEEGHYITYTSSKSGKRFEKTHGELKPYDDTSREVTLILDPDTKYQEIMGFGSSVSDSAAINWKSLPEVVQKHMINSYFGPKGLEYNMIRLPIGGSDFSTHAYAFNDLPVNDKELSNFTLAPEDINYKIPMIKAINEATPSQVHIIGTVWSPPVWMKTNNDWWGFTLLKKDYYQTFADYHLKFLQKYDEAGIPVWGITTTNEPLNGIIPLIPYVKNLTCLGWLQEDMGKWIVDHLGPTIRNSKYKDLKILTMDDQRYAIATWFKGMVDSHSDVLNYIDGVATHYYADGMTPVKILVEFHKTWPNLMLLNTEACEGAPTGVEDKVLLGSWQRAENYIHNILTNLNYHLVGWMDWNMCLNQQGGPTFIDNFVDSPVIVMADKKMFIKQPMFYAMGHFSKFIPRGSKRIQVTGRKPVSFTSVSDVAFLTPNNTIVTVLYNDGAPKTIALKLGDKAVTVEMEPESITTVEFPYEDKPKAAPAA